MSDESQPFRSGFVTIVGRPNVGKSTLVNRLVGQKVAIVSQRPQTTRNRIMGIYTVPGMQAAFVDTPGLWRGPGERALHQRMIREAEETLDGVDLAVLQRSAWIGGFGGLLAWLWL